VVGQGLAEGSDLLPDVPQGLNTTPVVAGLRVRLQPEAKDTYELLCKVLREESGIDLEREIVEEQRRANDRLAVVHENGEIGNGRSSSDIVKATSGGNSRAYVVGRLKREAAKAEGQDPLFLDPTVRLAAELLSRSYIVDPSIRAAAKAAGIIKPPDAYKQLLAWRDRVSDEERISFKV
jgi:hypothetical protein